MEKIILETPAKVNLFLDVTGKRPDGYHELSTVFQAVGLTDRILLEKTGTPGIVLDDATGLVPVPMDGTNLMVRAAKLLFDRHALPGGLSIRFQKSIPAGAGLGGGSSDAAAVLYGMNRIYGLGLTKAELMAAGVHLGADVPFFLEGGACLASGIGEELIPLPKKAPVDMVIVKPEASASTKAVFQAFDGTEARESRKADDTVAAFSGPDDTFPEAVSRSLYNALEPVTAEFVPDVAAIRRELLENGALGALMSGSGSSVFGIFRDRKTAENAFFKAVRGNRKGTLTATRQDGIREITYF